MNSLRDPRDDSEEPPPLLTSWRNLYLLVVGQLALLVLLFELLVRWAR